MKTVIPLPFGHKKNKFYLPSTHITTSDFGYIQPVSITEMVPKDDFEVSVKSFARLAPLPVPTFADVTLETCAFYVPLRQLWKDGREFFTHTKYWSIDGKSMQEPKVPCICNSMLAVAFATSRELSTPHTNSNVFDFSMLGTSDGDMTHEMYYNFTALGRRFFSLLVSLGYNINFDIRDDTRMSLLPYLAYIHVVHEYYLPQLAYPNPEVQILLSHESYWYLVKAGQWEGTSVDKRYTNPNNNNITREILFDYDPIFWGYVDDDYFSCAWKSPAGNVSSYAPGSSDYNSVIQVPQSATGKVTASPTNSEVRPMLQGISSGLTQVGLNILQAVTNYFTRNAVAGNKMVDRFLARFGVKLDDLVLQRPVFLGKHSQQVNFGDVMATSTVPDGGSNLGDYAGKGTSYGDGVFKYSSEEYGYMLVLQIIKPHTAVVSGRKRHVFHLNFDEFYSPEFDCIGVQAIRQDEVFAQLRNGQSIPSGYSPSGVFGFAPRYAEYKFGFSTLSGDYVVGSHYEGMKSYHLFRDIKGIKPVLDKGFLSAASNSTYNNFNRIFQYGGNEYDHFFLIHEVDITAYRAMHQIGDTLDLEDVHGEGDKVSVEFGGRHM